MQSVLRLSTRLRSGRTALNEYYATPPLKLMTLPHGADGALRAVQMSSSPGLLAGDTIDTDISLAEHTELQLFTQAYTRVLEMDGGGRAEQRNRITLAPHSRLTYLPHPLVLHRGSSLFQTTHIDLAEHSELIYGEILTAGRILNGEAFAFERLSSRLEIRCRGRLLSSDNIQWQPARHPPSQPGQMEGHTHQLNLYIVRTAATAAQMRALSDQIYQCLPENQPTAGDCLWGVSQAADQAVCLRALGGRAQTLQNLLHRTLAAVNLQQVPPAGSVFFS